MLMAPNASARRRARAAADTARPHYKWIVLSNTTLGVLIATINASILLIALPDIFRGIGVDPLQPGNISLLLWLIMGYGARPFATGGMAVAAGSFVLLARLPVDFAYPAFAAILLLNGIGMGLFAAPNRAGTMSSLPAHQRGVGAGMSTTFQNSSMVLSIGVFFSLMILGLAAELPHALSSGLAAQGVPPTDADRVSSLSPVAVLFVSLLGYNPVRSLLGPRHWPTCRPATRPT